MTFKERIARFFIGRNGPDRFYRFLIICCLVLLVINLFVRSAVIYTAELLLLGYAFFRFMSKNIYKRQAENRKYMELENKVTGFFRLQKRKFSDRKTHVYRTCPSCKKHLRLPKKKGQHNVCCPVCGNNFSVRV